MALQEDLDVEVLALQRREVTITACYAIYESAEIWLY